MKSNEKKEVKKESSLRQTIMPTIGNMKEVLKEKGTLKLKLK